jgi:hypothetical protein
LSKYATVHLSSSLLCIDLRSPLLPLGFSKTFLVYFVLLVLISWSND